MLELAKTIIELTNSKSDLVFRSLPSDDPKQRKPDIQKARNELGWEPGINLKEGLLKTIGYFEPFI
jgi:UDP-glucuronate decarboxylase